MLSLSKKILVPGSITELKIDRITEGQRLVFGGPWGSTELKVLAPLTLKRVDGSSGRYRQRDVSLRAAGKVPGGSISTAPTADMDPLGHVQPPAMFVRRKDEIRRSKRMHSALCARIKESRRSCARGSHYGFFIEGLGWRASVRSGKEVPGGDTVPMQVEKPGHPRVVPQLPPGLKVKEDDRFLELKIGNAHYTHFPLKEGLSAAVDDYKGQRFVVSGGKSKAVVGQFAARIRAIRTPEPYKGKGIRFQSEGVRRKEGKKAQ